MSGIVRAHLITLGAIYSTCFDGLSMRGFLRSLILSLSKDEAIR